VIERYKWYAITLPINLDQLYTKMSESYYSDGMDSGFQQIDRQASEFSFLWQSSIAVPFIDENGELNSQVVRTINRQDVAILRGHRTILRLKEPLRSTRPLFNALEKIMGYGFTCELISLTPRHIDRILDSVDSHRLTNSKISGSMPELKLLTRMEFMSKEGISLDYLEVLKGIKYTVDSASYEIFQGSHKGKISISVTGLCKASGSLSERLIRQLEQILITEQ